MELVSVIIATYNRSNVLKYSISSVLKQEYQNFEIIVVGDHCTDDTEEVVSSFKDPRISFHNLDENHGEQSGPNNFGFQKSKGSLIAWLNHDDLWFPDHLSSLTARLNETKSDIAYSWFIPYDHNKSGIAYLPPAFFNDNESGRYRFFVPASSWLAKRSAAEAVGPWKSAFELYNIPSQDWLMRAYKKVKKVSLLRKLTVIAIQSGGRKDSYKNRDSEEHDRVFEKLDDPGFRDELLTYLWKALSEHAGKRPVSEQLYAIIAAPLKAVMRFFSLDPASWKNAVKYGKRGGYINHLRQVRGLPEITNKKYD